MKSKTAGAAYKTARGNLLAMLILTAVNTLLALTGSDRYYLFTDFAAYIWAVFARGFYDFTGEAKWLVLGAAGAVLVMAVYFLCWLLSKKRRGWLTAALVLFSVDTAALVAGLVTAFEASSILDVVFHGLLLWYLAMGVRRGREAMEEPEGQEGDAGAAAPEYGVLRRVHGGTAQQSLSGPAGGGEAPDSADRRIRQP